MNLTPCDVNDPLVREKLADSLRSLPLAQKVRFLAYKHSKTTTSSALKRCTFLIQSVNVCVTKSHQSTLRFCKVENFTRKLITRINLP
jgi:hypothetical protein